MFVFKHLDVDGDVIWQSKFPTKEAAIKEAKKTLKQTLKNKKIVEKLLNNGRVEIYEQPHHDDHETLILKEIKKRKPVKKAAKKAAKKVSKKATTIVNKPIMVERTVKLASSIEDLIDDSYGSVQEFLDAMINANTILRMKQASKDREDHDSAYPEHLDDSEDEEVDDEDDF